MISSSLATRIELIFLTLAKETLCLATQGGILNELLNNSMFYHHKSNTCSYWSTGEKIYAEYAMRNAGLDEAQAGIKITRRNNNNLRYADDTTLTAESKELKSLLMKVKEKGKKVGLKLNIQNTNVMESGPITYRYI